MKITIKNWEKFNPKRDQKSYSWLRLNNDIAIQSDLFGMSAIQKYIWIVILCEASKQNKEEIEANISYLAYISMTDQKDVLAAIDELEKRNKINCLRECEVSLQSAVVNCSDSVSVTTPTNERTNERTNDTTRASAHLNSEDFYFVETENQELQIEPIKAKRKKESINKTELTSKLEFIYSLYPKKEGKKKGFETLSKLSPEKLDQVELSVKNYALICEYEKKEKQYIRQFSTFANSWEDFYEASPDDYKSPDMVAEERIDAALALYKQQSEI